MLSLGTASFWPSLYLLMPSQMPLRCMALAQAAKPCSVFFIAVRAVESRPGEVRKQCMLWGSDPPIITSSSLLCSMHFFLDPIKCLWASVAHLGLGRSLSVSQPWVKWQFILLEIPCLVLLLIYIQALYLSKPFIQGSPNNLYINTSLQDGHIKLFLQQHVCLLQKCLLRAFMRLVDNMGWWKKMCLLWLKVLSGSWNCRTQTWDRSRSLMLTSILHSLQGGWVGLIGNFKFLVMVSDFQCRPFIIHKHPVLTPVLSFCINRCLLFDDLLSRFSPLLSTEYSCSFLAFILPSCSGLHPQRQRSNSFSCLTLLAVIADWVQVSCLAQAVATVRCGQLSVW